MLVVAARVWCCVFLSSSSCFHLRWLPFPVCWLGVVDGVACIDRLVYEFGGVAMACGGAAVGVLFGAAAIAPPVRLQL